MRKKVSPAGFAFGAMLFGAFFIAQTGSFLAAVSGIGSFALVGFVPWLRPWSAPFDQVLMTVAEKISRLEKLLLGFILLIAWTAILIVAIVQTQQVELFGQRFVVVAAVMGAMSGLLGAFLTQTKLGEWLD